MNKSLQRGFIVMTVILLTVMALMIFLGRRQMAPTPVADSLAEQEDSLVAQYERRQEARRQENESHQPHYNQQWERRQEAFYDRVTSAPQDTLHRPNAYKPRPVLRFDLNEADTTDLQQLRGIGPVFARRIVRYRERLGGFVDKEQLMEVYGMTDTLYNLISPFLTLEHPAPRRLNVNTATLDELKRHAYLDYYKARAIVRFREQSGPFRKENDLLMVSQIDQETLDKLRPYIEL